MRHEVTWTSAALASAEDCVIHEQAAGVALSSSTTLPLDDGLGRIDYELKADARWRVLGATITISGRSDRRISIERSGDGWTVDGALRPDLAACVDLDLGWTPATNILPLRRARLEVGTTLTTTAVWVRFPTFEVVPATQTYHRLDATAVRYRSATFAADLEVDTDGIVLRYGDDLWVASTR